MSRSGIAFPQHGNARHDIQNSMEPKSFGFYVASVIEAFGGDSGCVDKKQVWTDLTETGESLYNNIAGSQKCF